MAKNENLHKAKEAKNDEFYTQYDEIQQEVNHYEDKFKGKTVLCNCDDPFESNFCKFFLRNFNYLGLKRLICTSYSTSPFVGQQLTLFDWMDEPVVQGNGYVMDIKEVPMANGRGVSDTDIDALLKSKKRGVKKLKGDGDFRSEECVEYLKQADIVVTNPPFSLFREYVAQLIEHKKDFLIIGNVNAITYKEIFPLIKDNKLWLGCRSLNKDMYFNVRSEYQKYLLENKKEGSAYKIINGVVMGRLASACWYTNLDHSKRHEELVLFKRYYGNEEDYPKYDNYDAINVDKTSDIPCDYFEDMGVPITYLDKHNPEQFEVVKFRKGNDEKDLTYTVNNATISNGTERNGTERNGTERNGTERNGTERNGTERNGTERNEKNYALLQNYHQTQDVTALSAYQSHSLTSTARTNLKLSEQPRVRERDSQTDCGTETAELHSRLSTERESTRGCLSRGRCNGIMGVPITFLDKYNPEQFEIIGLTQRGCHDETLETKKYDDYWEMRPNGTKTGSNGKKTNGNPNIAMNDGKHNYFINKDGHMVQSCYQRILVRRRVRQNENRTETNQG